MKIIKIIIISAIFHINLNAMPVRYTNETSFMKVMISSSEFSFNKISNKEYSINDRYHLASSFIKGGYLQIINKLKSYCSNEPILLEYVKLGNGKKMVINIAIP